MFINKCDLKSSLANYCIHTPSTYFDFIIKYEKKVQIKNLEHAGVEVIRKIKRKVNDFFYI